MQGKNKFLKIFGQVVAARRRKLGISQEELAHRSRINRTYIGDIERGARNIALKNVVKLSEGLQTTPSKLLSDVENIIS